METITLTLNQNQLNIIANALIKQPFEQVNELIAEISKQVQEQQKAPETKTK
jgi:hypothetical protein